MKKVRVEASTKKDRTSEIFGNPMSKKVIRKAQKSKQKNQKKYGDDSKVNYQCIIRDNPCIGEPLGVKNVVVTRKEGKGSFDEERGVIVGNIRMDLDITVSPWQSHLLHTLLDIHHTGWI